MTLHERKKGRSNILQKLEDADLPLFANTPAQAESLVQAARGIGLYINANKRSLCFKQGAISTVSGRPQISR